MAYTSCYAYSHSAGKEYGLDGVVFNTAWAGTKITESLQGDVKAKFHPEGCDTVKSVFDHELGHRIDELLHVSQQLGSKDWYQEAIVLGAGYIKDNLSKYAMTNLKEFVAEAWSEYLNNPNPRELASHVGEMIKAEYEARYKKAENNFSAYSTYARITFTSRGSNTYVPFCPFIMELWGRRGRNTSRGMLSNARHRSSPR